MSTSCARSNEWFSANLIRYFDQELTVSETNDLSIVLAWHHLEQLTLPAMDPVRVALEKFILASDVLSICRYDLPSGWSSDAHNRYHVNQIIALFSKRADLGCDIDKELVAFTKFCESEKACEVTNRCFLLWGQGRFVFDPLVERVLHTAQRKISRVLGDCPALSTLVPKMGPGASTQVPKRNACLAEKLRQVPACSTNLAPLAGDLLSLMGWGDGQSEYEVDVPIHFSKLDFVPKNAKTFRGTMTQPALNSMWQGAVGEYIADQLKYVGIDIHDQSKNQHWAWLGSKVGIAATIDLSSASDTIATGLVQHLLSSDWFDLLFSLRCSEVLYEDTVFRLHQFSSMGNGFTFPLETLIFWALSASVVEIYDAHTIVPTLVYGDDIIVPVGSAVPLIKVLTALGFTPNPKKSFWEGTFRESCGCDYVSGINVRPYFIDGLLTGEDIFRIHNFYVKRGDAVFASCLAKVIEPTIRLRGPQGFGDGHLHSLAYVSRRVSRKGWSGYTFETWTRKPVLLDEGVWSRYLREKPKGFKWKEKAYYHAIRVATYAISLKGESSMVDHLKPVLKKHDNDGIVTPGTQGVHRTKIYTFEAPTLKQG